MVSQWRPAMTMTQTAQNVFFLGYLDSDHKPRTRQHEIGREIIERNWRTLSQPGYGAGHRIRVELTGALAHLGARIVWCGRIVGGSSQGAARAFAFIWSNSAWVIVPASRSCLADAI